MTEATLFTPQDSQRIAALARRVARELELPEHEAATVADLAGVHDIGRRALPPQLLHKSTPLSPAEIALLHTHPQIGADFVARIPALAHLAPLVRSCHERWDGSGYPDRLRGEEIPLACRIVQACEAYVSMLAERPYREELDPQVVREVFTRNRGSQFCPVVTDALLTVIGAPQEAAAPATRQGRRTVAKAARRDPRRTATFVYVIGALVGVAVALVLALPVESVADRCPPRGEGLVQCQVQKIGMRLSLLFLFSILGFASLAHFVAFTVPTFYARWRAGELCVEDRPFPEGDQVLLAAHWGFVPEERSAILRRHRFRRRTAAG